jgi:hypothetical protein
MSSGPINTTNINKTISDLVGLIVTNEHPTKTAINLIIDHQQNNYHKIKVQLGQDSSVPRTAKKEQPP